MIHITKQIRSGDVLLLDAERALGTEAVLEYLSENNVVPFVFPCVTHQLLNPCDNSFHSIFKRHYYMNVSNTNTQLTMKDKMNIARESYDAVSEETIRSMFIRCGLVPSGEDKRKLVLRLMSEGLGALEKNQQHKRCLLKFLKWTNENNLLELCPVEVVNIV